MRYKREVDLVPSVVLCSLFTTAYALTQSPQLSINIEQMLYVSVIGFILVPFAFVILTIAPRYANSAEVQLVYLLESILGPLWVWMVINETPPWSTVAGGSLLLLSVAWFVRNMIREEREAADQR